MLMTTKKHHKKELFSGIGIGILFTIWLIFLGVILAINLRFLYYADIHLFDIDKTSGLSYETIRSNYDALIDYCSPFFTGDLVFPTLTSSANGLSHFAEVKVIFQTIYWIFAISSPILIIVLLLKLRQKSYHFLRVAAITTILLPAITALLCCIDFNWTFTLMHRILFRNNDWIFDPTMDPVILILPEEFFLQCAVVIILTVFLGVVMLLLLYKHYKKKYDVTPLIKPAVNYIYR